MKFSFNQLEHCALNLDAIEDIYEKNKPIFVKFIDKIPFDQFLNINILDSDLMRNYIKILKLLVTKPELYGNIINISDIFKFILINITVVSKPFDKDVLLNLLEILKEMLNSMKNFRVSFENVINRESVIDIIITITENELCDITALKSCIVILDGLLILDVKWSNSITKAITELFKKCKHFEAVTEICHLINITTYNNIRDLDDDFSVISTWLFEDSHKYLRKEANTKVLKQIISCLVAFLKRTNYLEMSDERKEHYGQFLANVMSRSGNICKFCCNEPLRDSSIKLLYLILKEFIRIQEISVTKIEDIYKELYELPPNLKDWPKTDTKSFFCICNMLFIYDTLLWSSEIIVNSIASVLYSPRFVTATEIKLICFLYSAVYLDCSNSTVKIMNTDLIRRFSIYSNQSFIYTYHIAQLVWILSSNNDELKIVTLTQWLNKGNYDTIIFKVIKYCAVEQICVEILIQNYDKEIGGRVSNLIKKLHNYEISIEVAYSLSSAKYNQKLFKILMLSEPGVPKKTVEALYLVKFMSFAIILFKNDEELIKLCCTYSIQLINRLKNDGNSIIEFCKKFSNITWLLNCVKNVKDETCVEVIRLLLILVRIQAKHHVKLEQEIQYNITNFIEGSNVIKIRKGLELVHFILCYTDRGLFINMIQEKYLNLLFQIINICSKEEFATTGYKCLTLMLKSFNEIATDTLLVMHLEMQCMMSTNLEYSKEFLNFLGVWMKTLKQFKLNKFILIPEFTIRSYILRCSVTMNLNVERYLRLLNYIVNDDEEKKSI